MFDSSIHVDGKYSTTFKTLPAFYSRLTANADIRVSKKPNTVPTKTSDAAAMRFVQWSLFSALQKFYIEKRGKRLARPIVLIFVPHGAYFSAMKNLFVRHGRQKLYIKRTNAVAINTARALRYALLYNFEYEGRRLFKPDRKIQSECQ